MNKELDKAVLRKAIDTYGDYAQIDVAIEEMAELQKALLKMRRAKVETIPCAFDAIVDEIADVYVMMRQLVMIYDCKNQVKNRIKYKVDRLRRRMDGAE